MPPTYLTTGPEHPTARLVFAHGAGAGMDTSFMQAVARLLAERGIAAFRFEFGYMAARREGGTRKPAAQGRAAHGRVSRRPLPAVRKLASGAAAHRRQVDGRARREPRGR